MRPFESVQKLHVTGIQPVIASHHTKFTGIHFGFQCGHLPKPMTHPSDVFPTGRFNGSMGMAHCRGQRADDVVEMVMRMHVRHRRLHGPAVLMSQHQNQWRMQMLYGILQAAQNGVIGNIACHANIENITQPLIEQDLWRNARIGAGDHGGKGMLSVANLFQPFMRLVWMLAVVGHKALIPLAQALQGLGRQEVLRGRGGQHNTTQCGDTPCQQGKPEDQTAMVHW